MKSYDSFRVGYDEETLFLICIDEDGNEVEKIRLTPQQAKYIPNEIDERWNEFSYGKAAQGIEV